MRFNLLVWVSLLLALQYSFICRASLLDDIQQLSAADMQGRKTGSAGAELARQFIAARFAQLQLAGFDNSASDKYQQAFVYSTWPEKSGINVLGWRPGCTYPGQYIVVTAHYDHLGTQGRKIFHGADDNASGVAAMLELAARLSAVCPAYSYIFLATDAEEDGLHGSKAFVAAPPVPVENIVLNLNLDMISRADRRGRLYLTGARRYPALTAQLAKDFSKLQFLHHRGPGRMARNNPRYDWPNASDHGPFYRAGIPYLFFGGQEHPHYHTPDDTWQRIEPDFLEMAISAIWQTVQWLEQHSPQTLRAAQR
ncbi:M28 family peptidase [Rheinheimera sp. NSM]|uniref:M28 family peptidase n=1 Tax=Rheinheimera sp. NSM TaxID=3457884 RepID=UPI0040351F32